MPLDYSDPDYLGLMSAVCLRPSDPLPRLALADYFEEKGTTALLAGRAKAVRSSVNGVKGPLREIPSEAAACLFDEGDPARAAAAWLPPGKVMHRGGFIVGLAPSRVSRRDGRVSFDDPIEPDLFLNFPITWVTPSVYHDSPMDLDCYLPTYVTRVEGLMRGSCAKWADRAASLLAAYRGLAEQGFGNPNKARIACSRLVVDFHRTVCGLPPLFLPPPDDDEGAIKSFLLYWGPTAVGGQRRSHLSTS